jgi:hypothetical protein
MNADTSKFFCQFCNKTFTNKRNQKNHEKNEICKKSKNILQCIECNKKFNSNGNLYYHIENKVCFKNKEYECDKCSKKMKYKFYINHIKNNCIDIYQCRKCSIKIFNLIDYRYHKNRPCFIYKCILCKIHFVRHEELQRHRKNCKNNNTKNN